MKAHVKIYTKYFDLVDQDKPECECCGNIAVDVHHINHKLMGVSKEKDFIENLIGLCKNCDKMAHSGEISKGTLKLVHKYRMAETGKKINYSNFKLIK